MAQLDITAAWGGQAERVPALVPARGRVPAIDFDALGGVDLDRLERGLQLDARRVGEGRYHVRGGSHDHWVDLYSTSHPRCDCGDHLWRDQLCKHILAALLREGNDRVVSALGRLFMRLKGMPRAA
jgi:SWIM zinc finger